MGDTNSGIRKRISGGGSDDNNKSSRKKQQRREVLSEEEYTSTLSTIIQRDYYSDLPDLQLKMAVLNRRSAQDFAGAVRVRRAARKLKNHEDFMAEMEDMEEQQIEDGVRVKARPLHRESLTGFHSRVTSEDNAEYEQVQRHEVKANRERLETLFTNSSNQLRLKEHGEDHTDDVGNPSYPENMLASDEFNAEYLKITLPKPEKPVPVRNSLFFVPSPALPPSSRADVDDDKSAPLLLQGDGDEQGESEVDSQARALMPPPCKSNKQTSISSCVANAKQELVEYVPKKCLDKRIEPSQTRFPQKPTTTTLARQVLPSHIGRNANDTVSDYSTDASTDLDSVTSKSLEEERRAGVRRRNREQQQLVNMTPLLVPGTGGKSNNDMDDVEASPIVTWGSVAGTPLQIRPVKSDPHDSSTTSTFAIAPENERDKAALAAQITFEKRKAKVLTNKEEAKLGSHGDKFINGRKRSAATFSGNTAKRDVSSFSPAAMSLLAKTSNQRNPSSARSSVALASALRSSYTPQRIKSSSSRRRQGSSSGKADLLYKETPRLAVSGESKHLKKMASGNSARPTTTGPSKSGSITDGLLNLP